MDNPTENAETNLIAALRKRCVFWLNGMRWLQGTEPDPMCTAAADEIERLRMLLQRALPYVDTNPDLHRAGGDELNVEIRMALSQESEELT